MSTSTENPYIEQSLLYQDLEKIRFSENLRKNASDYSQFVNDRVNQMLDETSARKRTAFQKAQIDLSRYMDMDHNAGFYKARNADVERLQSAIIDNNKRIAQQVSLDKDISRRQFEINEYFYHNKLETLFFLQLFFIATLSMAIIVYGQKISIIGSRLAGLLGAILVAIVIVVGIARYYYTERTRDRRLWHKRYFAAQKPLEPVARCGDGSVPEFNLNTVVSENVTQCADELAGDFSDFGDNLMSEMRDYQELGAKPKGIFGNIPGSICNTPVAASTSASVPMDTYSRS